MVAFSIVNLLGPSLPCKSLNPLTGIRDVPVANCKSRDFCSASQPLMHYKSLSAGRARIGQGVDTHSPEILNDRRIFLVATIISVFLPVIHVYISNSSYEELKFTFVKDIYKIRWY